MFVERVLSLNDGWTILNAQKADEWQQALFALQLMDYEAIVEALKDVKDDGEDDQYVSYYMFTLFNGYLQNIFQWPDILPIISNSAVSNLKPRVIKNGLSASVVGVDERTGGDLVNTLYLTIPYHYKAGLIDVSVIFVPTKSMVSHLIELGAKPTFANNLFTEESCRAELAKFSALSSQAPIVLAFFSPTAPEELVVEEATPLKVGGHTIERTLEFAPEYYQASVGLLSYFGEVLRQKDPQTKAKVRIEQEGNIVRLRIESPSGDIETIEKELEQYALIVTNQAPPESLLDNPGQIIQLKAQLRMAQMQVEMAHDLRQLSDGRITSLEKQVEFLQNQFAAQILQNNKTTDLNHKVIDLATQQASSHERMQAALLAHGQLLFKDMLEESRGNFQLLTAIQNLHQNLLSGLTTIDVEEQIKQALETVKQQKPGMLSRIYSQVEGAALKAGAGASLGWAAEVVKHAIAS